MDIGDIHPIVVPFLIEGQLESCAVYCELCILEIRDESRLGRLERSEEEYE